MPDATWTPQAIAEWWSGLAATVTFGGMVLAGVIAVTCWGIRYARRP